MKRVYVLLWNNGFQKRCRFKSKGCQKNTVIVMKLFVKKVMTKAALKQNVTFSPPNNSGLCVCQMQ